MRIPTREQLLRGKWTCPAERCPKCNAHLLFNVVGVRWCSHVGCDYTAPPPDQPVTPPKTPLASA